MASAKTPKKNPVAAPAAAKPAPVARAKAVKPAPKPAVRAAAVKAPQDAVVHSAEIVAETAVKVAETPVKAAETIAAAVTQTVDTAAPKLEKAAVAVKEVAAKPSKAVAVVKSVAAEAQHDLVKGVTPFLDYSRENAILLVAAGNQFALGLHKLSQSLIDWSAESCDKGVAAGQAMLSAKSVEEVIDLSRSLAKDSIDQLIKESSELSALSSKLIEDTIVPLPGRLAAAVEKLATRAA